MEFLKFFLRVLGAVLLVIALFALAFSQGSAVAAAGISAGCALALFAAAAVLHRSAGRRQRV